MKAQTSINIKERETSLKEAYQKILAVGLGNRSIDDLDSFVELDVMGYGTALDEKILSITDFIELVQLQRKQSINFDDFHYTSKPVLIRFNDNSTTVVVVDEIELVTVLGNDSNKLNLRMTAVFDFIDVSWKLIHWHASKAEHVSGGEDPWHVEEWKKKTEILEKMIDEKTAELVKKNNELAIEASLERVRAVAMSMSKSDDLLSICKVSYRELEKLGFVNLRAVLIHILDDETRTFTDYDYCELFGGEISNLSYDSHPVVVNYFKQIKSRKDAFAEAVLSGSELESWKKVRLETGQKNDPRLNTTDALYYYGYSIGFGDFSISTLKPINEKQRRILKRFRNVFDLAYRRFIDIEKAEAQAREAQIEAALERVRSRSMAMHQSKELADLSLELVKQVHSLGVDAWFCAFNIYDDDPNGSLEWGSNGQGTFPEYRTPREGIFLEYFEAGRRGEVFLVKEISEKDSPAHYEYLCSLHGVGEQLLKMKDAGIPFPKSQIDHVAYFKYGYIIFITLQPVPESHDIFKRFAKVFEQTYTRFLDLQKSEEQRKIIQTENDRKTQELEEARKLQLAMLPKEIPQLSKLDIAVYMQTATEVGGDYYDFSTKDDGSLNICLGDATGHGLKAGTLVAMMKSLFINDSVKLDISKFFNSSNETLKKMSLSRMMMAFAMINIYGNRIRIVNAGIPPVYIYRKKENIVEEINLNGLPIGAIRNSKYEVYENEINHGDVILMMSDGMPELQNRENEMYGYKRIKEVLIGSADKNSEVIITSLTSEIRIWSNNTEPDDDITFVVIKVK